MIFLQACKKLDKNLRNESDGDLLKCIQKKQNRTRRMSKCVDSPYTSQNNINLNIPVRTLDANTVATNYRRRLSLAVPQQRSKFVRERSPSDVSALQRLNQQPDGYQNSVSDLYKKRKMFRRSKTSGSQDESVDKSELSPLLFARNTNPKMHSTPCTPTRQGFDAIQEIEDEDISTSSGSTQKNSPTKQKGVLKKTRSVDKSPSESPCSTPTKSKVDFNFSKAVNARKHNKKRPMWKTKSLDVSNVPDAPEEQTLNKNGSHSFEDVPTFDLGSESEHNVLDPPESGSRENNKISEEDSLKPSNCDDVEETVSQKPSNEMQLEPLTEATDEEHSD